MIPPRRTWLAALLQQIVLGKSPLMIPALHLALERKVRNMGRPGLASCAISAIDTALWDLKGRLLKVPLVSLLGQSRHHVEAYGSGGFTSYSEDQLVRQLAGWASQGFKSVKMKIGTGDDTLQRVSAARKALPECCELYVDADGAYSRKQAFDHGESLRSLASRGSKSQSRQTTPSVCDGWRSDCHRRCAWQRESTFIPRTTR